MLICTSSYVEGEGAVVFGYRVLAVAATGTIDIKSTITYNVRGLGITCEIKALLLSMTAWTDLRKMLVAQDQAAILDNSARGSGYRFNSTSGTRPDAKGNVQVKQEPGDKPKCFKCGIVGHISRDCKKNNGKCFKCGQPGHLAAQCHVRSGAPPPSTDI